MPARMPWASAALGKSRQLDAAIPWVARQAPWTHVLHLTYQDNGEATAVHPETCQRDVRRLARYAARILFRTHVPVFWVIGRQQNGNAHAHVLAALPATADASHLRALDTAWKNLTWRGGHTRIERLYDAAGIVRYALRGHTTWDVNVACPRTNRCRRGGNHCIAAPSPW